MKTTILAIVAILAIVFSGTRAAFAQMNPERLKAMDSMVAQVKQQAASLGPHKRFVSAAWRNIIGIAARWNELRPLFAAAARRTELAPAEATMELLTGIEPQIPVAAFDPASALSRLGGFTRNETSTAWCGNNAMVGFNDTGAYLATGGGSIEGYALTTSVGTSTQFTYENSPPTGSSSGMTLLGGPVVACSGTTFYYASLFQNSSTGTNGVALWSADLNSPSPSLAGPSIAIQKSSSTHTVDKDWMTVDPSNGTIYVTYTDFDSSGAVCGSSGNKHNKTVVPRTAIELVSSTSGGMSWASPTVVRYVCGNPAVQGSQIGIDPSRSLVYVAWEALSGGSNLTTREIDIAQSANSGGSFTPAPNTTPVKVSSVNYVGDSDYYGLQGAIRDLEMPSLAVDQSNGQLFVAWNDGTKSVPDSLSFSGDYRFADILLSASQGGSSWQSWLSPVTVNTNGGDSTDQFEPAVAVEDLNNTQTVAVCYYDRAVGNPAANFLIQRTCSESINGGSWGAVSFSPALPTYPSVSNQDKVLYPNDYMGDYDTLAVDGTGTSSGGFLGSFGDNSNGNPNVSAVQF
jgi:hypothetical protein